MEMKGKTCLLFILSYSFNSYLERRIVVELSIVHLASFLDIEPCTFIAAICFDRFPTSPGRPGRKSPPPSSSTNFWMCSGLLI